MILVVSIAQNELEEEDDDGNDKVKGAGGAPYASSSLPPGGGFGYLLCRNTKQGGHALGFAYRSVYVGLLAFRRVALLIPFPIGVASVLLPLYVKPASLIPLNPVVAYHVALADHGQLVPPQLRPCRPHHEPANRQPSSL